MNRLLVDHNSCNLCGKCVDLCPFSALVIEVEELVVGEQCNLCGACIPECPEQALKLEREAVGRPNDKLGWSGVLVVAEVEEEEVSPTTLELLGAARELAGDYGHLVSAVVLGSGVGDLAPGLVQRGADRVYVADDAVLEKYRDEPYTQIISSLVCDLKPGVVLMGATSTGRSLMPRLAARLGTGLTADCTELSLDSDGLLLQTRPAFGGNIMATIQCPAHRPQMATVRPRVLKAMPPDRQRLGEVVQIPVDSSTLRIRTEVLEEIRDLVGETRIESADVIVAGGRGCRGPEGFALVSELATALGAAVGASRAAVDEGWVPATHQVGQTGKTVSPRVFIACGISGSVQHLAGMRSSDVIVAINTDADAPMMKLAHYGLQGDLFEIIPAILDVLSQT